MRHGKHVNGPGGAEPPRLLIGMIAACLAAKALVCPAQNPQDTIGASSSGTVPNSAPQALQGLSIEQLLQVHVTTVTRGESTVGESPAAIFVITQEMIRRSGARYIPEILRMVPGVNVARVSSNEWVVGIRGFDNLLNNKLLVQIDGRSVYSPIHSGVFWNSVDYPLEDIDRIEVIRGPGGAVWGANAVAGIINIITKSAKDSQGLYVNSGGGTEDRAFTDFRFGGKLSDALHYRVYGKWFDNADEYNADGLARDAWSAGRAGGRIDWTPGDKDTFTLQGDWFETEAGVSAATLAGATNDDSNGGNVLARWTHELGKDSNWQLQAYWDLFEEHTTDGTGSFGTNTYDVDFQQQFPFGDRQKIIYGLGYRVEQSFFDDVSITPSVDVGESVFSFFLQDEIKIVDDRLFLTLGTKLEDNNFTGFEYQPSGRLLWTPTKAQSVWLAVSRAVRTPDVLENNVNIPPTLVANPNLQSEQVIAYEMGYRAQATKSLSVDTALFYNNYDRLSVFGPATANEFLPLEFTNGMSGDTYGFELAATWTPYSWWSLSGNYSYLKMNLHADRTIPLAYQDVAEEAERQSPQNHFYIRSSFDLPHRVELDLILRYVDNLPADALKPAVAEGLSAPLPGVESYLTLDARLAWKATNNMEFAVVGKNLLDDRHPEYTGTPPIEIERSVYMSMTYRW